MVSLVVYICECVLMCSEHAVTKILPMDVEHIETFENKSVSLRSQPCLVQTNTGRKQPKQVKTDQHARYNHPG